MSIEDHDARVDTDNARINIYETVTQSVTEALEAGVAPWKRPWNSNCGPSMSLVTRKPYRGINVLLLAMRPFRDNRWLTFRQALDAGGNVRKGERGTTVVFWKFHEPDESEIAEGRAVRRPPVLRHYTVFNLEQTEGIDVPEPYAPDEGPRERIARAELVVREMPEAPMIREGGAVACYVPSRDLVSIPPLSDFSSADHYYATLFHELAHATGHEARLARKGVMEKTLFGSGEYGKEELVAELGSAFVCATLGLDNSLIGDSASYVASWLSVLRNDPKALVMAAGQAQKVADYVLGERAEWL